MKESAIASYIRLDAAYLGVDLWRNNSGAFQDETGRWVRYGLCNESAQQSAIIKSSDLIGITPVMITPDMVGQVIGVFTAIETKPTDWRLIPSDDRGLAQKKFHDIVKKAGGFAGFASTIEQFRKIVKK
jgi:hypothetical protein